MQSVCCKENIAKLPQIVGNKNKFNFIEKMQASKASLKFLLHRVIRNNYVPTL